MKKLIIASLTLAALIGLHIATTKASSCLPGNQGGTGNCTTSSTNIGKALVVSSTDANNFITWSLGTAGGGGSTTTINGVSSSTFLIIAGAGITSTQSGATTTFILNIGAGCSGNNFVATISPTGTITCAVPSGGASSTNVFGTNGVTVVNVGVNATASLDTTYAATWTGLETFLKGLLVNSTATFNSSTIFTGVISSTPTNALAYWTSAGNLSTTSTVFLTAAPATSTISAQGVIANGNTFTFATSGPLLAITANANGTLTFTSLSTSTILTGYATSSAAGTGSCTNCNITVNGNGIVTSIANGSAGSGGGLASTTPWTATTIPFIADGNTLQGSPNLTFNSSTGQFRIVAQSGNNCGGNSQSVGGCANLNTSNVTSTAFTIYSNQGSNQTGNLIRFMCDNPNWANNVDCANIQSAASNSTVLQVTGSSTSKGVVKITLNDAGGASQVNASALSLLLNSTSGQAIFANSPNGTSGTVFQFQDKGTSVLSLIPEGAGFTIGNSVTSTFSGQSVHTSLATFNGGITNSVNPLNLTNGSVLQVGGTAVTDGGGNWISNVVQGSGNNVIVQAPTSTAFLGNLVQNGQLTLITASTTLSGANFCNTGLAFALNPQPGTVVAVPSTSTIQGYPCNTGTSRIMTGGWSTQLFSVNAAATNSVSFATTGDSEIQVYAAGTPTSIGPGQTMMLTGSFESSTQYQVATGTGYQLVVRYSLFQTSTPFTVSGQGVTVSSTIPFSATSINVSSSLVSPSSTLNTQLTIPLNQTLTANGQLATANSTGTLNFFASGTQYALSPFLDKPFTIDNATGSEDVQFWIVNQTSTIQKIYTNVKVQGDTIGWNAVWAASRGQSSSTSNHIFTNFITTTATTTPDCWTTVTSTACPNFFGSQASSTLKAGSVVRFISSSTAASVSSTELFFDIYYTTTP